MKILITAIAAAALLAGAGAAQAQSNSTNAGMTAGTSRNNSMNSDSSMKADNSMKSHKSSSRKHMARSHHRYHHQTTGIGSENNARARGSQLPGKDRLNSKAYIQEH